MRNNPVEPDLRLSLVPYIVWANSESEASSNSLCCVSEKERLWPRLRGVFDVRMYVTYDKYPLHMQLTRVGILDLSGAQQLSRIVTKQTKWLRVWMGFIDYWLMALFFVDYWFLA